VHRTQPSLLGARIRQLIKELFGSPVMLVGRPPCRLHRFYSAGDRVSASTLRRFISSIRGLHEPTDLLGINSLSDGELTSLIPGHEPALISSTIPVSV
jgi:hypothetical protein